ncbi:MAG: Hsp20/alpha crystallin family protein [Actinomycetota bacterium]|nr:Hsp20/alpha crystallin family protein [Actinomycetota bacterium]
MLMRTDPFRELDRFFDGGLASRRNTLMGMDAYREDDRLIARFDLPGVDPDSIDVTVEKNQLTVRAERSWEPAEDVQVIASERPQGTFTRSLFLGEGLDVDHIEADYDHGVLTLTVPVADQAKPRKISVGSGQAAISS